MEVSRLFVVLMGMGTTFIGLICIIFLTTLMGRIMQALERQAPQPPSRPSELPKAERAPGLPADGIPGNVKIAILAALMQTPGFRLEDVTDIVIHKV